MNTKFSIQRFGLLLKSDIVKNYKTILTLLLVMVGIYLLAALFSGTNGMYNAQSSFMGYIGVIIFFLPFILYKNLFHTVKGVSYSMLPASQFEKFASVFVQCAILIPFALLLFAWILTLIGAGITGNPDLILDLSEKFTKSSSFSFGNMGFFDSFFWGAIGGQSIAIWGIYFFKTKKIGKTLLTICCCGIALFILGIIGIGSLVSIGIGEFDQEILVSGMSSLPERFLTVFSLFFSILLPFLLWIWSYFKMRRQQF